jgi:hypothetical protein
MHEGQCSLPVQCHVIFALHCRCQLLVHQGYAAQSVRPTVPAGEFDRHALTVLAGLSTPGHRILSSYNIGQP